MVEFALVVVLFLSVILAIVDFAIMYYVNLTMQHAVRSGTRYAVTGQSNLGTDRRSALIQAIKNNSNGLYDKNIAPHDEPNMQSYNNPSISVIKPGNVTFTNYSGTHTTGDPGKPNEFIVVKLTYTWPLITPILKPLFTKGEYTFAVKSTMRNEPFTGL